MKKTAIAIAISAASMHALALSPSVGEPGFSGSVNLGIGGGNVETNFLAEVMGTDLSDKKLSSLDSNDDEDIGMPAIGYDLGWTFASGNTRVSISNDERSGVLEFDPGAKLALRYDNDRFGNFELAGLVSGGQTSTWKDPYDTTGDRSNSDMTNNGGRISWDKIFSSNFEVYIETREADIDQERSGASLDDLNARDRKLLDRNGDVNKASVGYVFELNDKHTLRPAITYVDHDLDGDAMSRDGVVGSLGYGYKGDGFNLGVMGKYGQLDGDKTNPIFNDVNDTDTYSIAAGMKFPGMFGLKNWVPNFAATYAKNDSDIDFNDAQVWLVSVSMFRAF
jgi:hypothetical protein